MSVILVHSPKGEILMQECSSYIKAFEIPDNLFTNMYERYSKNAVMPENGKKFINNVFDLGFSNTVNKYITPNHHEKRRLEWLKIKRILNRHFKPLLIIFNKVRGKG